MLRNSQGRSVGGFWWLSRANRQDDERRGICRVRTHNQNDDLPPTTVVDALKSCLARVDPRFARGRFA